MKQQIQLRIAEPCLENWNSMTPTTQGRYCMNCQKQVVDFTVMTDKEILEHISVASSGICGRADNDQLNRVLHAPAEPRRIWWRYWMGVAASLVIMISKTGAQVKAPAANIVVTPPLFNIEQYPERTVGKIAVSPEPANENKYIVNGIVKDEFNQPVVGATIMIKDTKKGVVSDNNGKFTIPINNTKDIVLHISSVGYEMQDVKIANLFNVKSVVNVNLVLRNITMGLMGEVVVVTKKKKSWLNYLKKETEKCVSPVSPVSEQKLSIYPNPVIKGSVIKMKIDHLPEGNYRMAVYDLLGNRTAEQQITIKAASVFASLPCDHRFSSGVYVISITGQGKTLRSTCIVQ